LPVFSVEFSTCAALPCTASLGSLKNFMSLGATSGNMAKGPGYNGALPDKETETT
jgi:hypothetical protein